MPRRTERSKPDGAVEIREFTGMVPNQDPHDLPTGVSQQQINATAIRPGELRARLGARVVLFL